MSRHSLADNPDGQRVTPIVVAETVQADARRAISRAARKAGAR